MDNFKTRFNPLVSIIIPVYNGANYIREAINSALEQTYKNIEIIVINDGSIDNTEEIIKSYGDKVKYFRKNNGGVSTAINLGIKKMKGDYFSWLSHDDVYFKDKIEKQINILKKLKKDKRENTILYSNWIIIDENSKIFDKFSIEKKYDVKKLNYPLYPIYNSIVHGCTLLIPKKCFNNTGWFNPKLKATQDYDMWLRMFPKFNLIFQPEFLVKFRYHKKQGSRTLKEVPVEGDRLWIKMIKSISDEQKIKISGSLINFYMTIYRTAKESKYENTKRLAQKYLINKWAVVLLIRNEANRFLVRLKNKVKSLY